MKKKTIVRVRVFVILPAILFGIFYATLSSAKDYTFSWSANDAPVDGYKLYYKKGGGASHPFDGSSANEGYSPIDIGDETSFTVTGLEDNTTYHFALTAYDGLEESDLSKIITVFPVDVELDRVQRAIYTINYLLLLDKD